MPGPLFQVGAIAMCPHGGQVQAISADVRVLASGTPVTVVSDQFLVVGCPFVVAGVPQPCVMVQWTVPTARCLFAGQPGITAASAGICIAVTGTPAGPAVVSTTQPRVIAS